MPKAITIDENDADDDDDDDDVTNKDINEENPFTIEKKSNKLDILIEKKKRKKN